jgi:Fe-S cluster biogenesis protein NfuA
VANGTEFPEKLLQLGQLIAQFDQMPENPQKAAGMKLVQLLMDVHGAGLDRIMEIICENEIIGPAIIEKLGQDSITGSLLLLYSLHPDDLETRVKKAIERIRPRLRKVSYSVDLTRVNEGTVEVRVTSTSSGHTCGSTAKDVRAIVEEGVYELAPDVTSLEIRGLEEPANAGFVTLESLMGHSLVASAHDSHALVTKDAD